MSEQRKANLNMTLKLLGIALGAFGFGFALVPLYSVLCDVTGYGDNQRLLRKATAAAGNLRSYDGKTRAGDGWGWLPGIAPVRCPALGRILGGRRR